MTYDEILDINDLNKFEPQEAVGILGLIFETSRENQNINDIKKGLNLSEKVKIDDFQDYDKMLFHYNVSNGWSYVQMLTQKQSSSEFWGFEGIELEKQIINLRLAVIYSHNCSVDFNKSQILTNLGNLFSYIGRFSEAQTYWQLAIEATPNFPMAIGNIGYGLFNYGKALYDIDQQNLFFILAYRYLKDAVALELYEEARTGFQNIINELELRFDKDQLEVLPDWGEYKLGDTEEEIKYRKWCLENRLYLNPLNDIIVDNVVSYDCLLLPSMTLRSNEPPVYQTIFNQIKQEVVSARYLLYEGINLKGTHFSDVGNLQMDTLDNVIYSYSSEKVKISYRLCYSILDKIAYLLNEYLELGLKPNNVSFRKIWYTYEKKSKVTSVNSKISETQNWAFRGLFWLSKDFYETDSSFLTTIEPESKELAKIRNYIEHKSFKIVESVRTKTVDNGLTYVITRTDLESKALKILKLVRAAMIYLSLGINNEEQKKKFDVPTIPIYFSELDDEYKY